MDTISVIVRLHAISGVDRLEIALACLLGQVHKGIEVIVALQDFSEDDLGRVMDLCGLFPQNEEFRIFVKNWTFEDEGDHRAALINRSMACATGRFLAFLDYDDIVYGHSYSALIDRINKTGSTVAMGGVVRTEYFASGKAVHILRKRPIFQDGHKLDFFFNNRFPVHSYVIDRTAVVNMPEFWEGQSRNEDYKFLFELLSRNSYDVGALEMPVCEYLIDIEGSNTILAFRNDGESIRAWRSSELELDNWKKKQDITISYEDFVSYREALVSNDSVETVSGINPSDRVVTGGDALEFVFHALKRPLLPIMDSRLTKVRMVVDSSVAIGDGVREVRGWVTNKKAAIPKGMAVYSRKEGRFIEVTFAWESRPDVAAHLKNGKDTFFGFRGRFRDGTPFDGAMGKVVFDDGSWGQFSPLGWAG